MHLTFQTEEQFRHEKHAGHNDAYGTNLDVSQYYCEQDVSVLIKPSNIVEIDYYYWKVSLPSI